VKTYKQMVSEVAKEVSELYPWDVEAKDNPDMLTLDIREPYEFDAMHIKQSINVPRGILEQSCEWDYEETIPELVCCRQREIIVVCRSGYRSVLANDYELPLVDNDGKEVDMEVADEYFASKVREEQRKPV
jgi:rhodanese-related sulfurtransferase